MIADFKIPFHLLHHTLFESFQVLPGFRSIFHTTHCRRDTTEFAIFDAASSAHAHTTNRFFGQIGNLSKCCTCSFSKASNVLPMGLQHLWIKVLNASIRRCPPSGHIFGQEIFLCINNHRFDVRSTIIDPHVNLIAQRLGMQLGRLGTGPAPERQLANWSIIGIGPIDLDIPKFFHISYQGIVVKKILSQENQCAIILTNETQMRRANDCNGNRCGSSKQQFQTI
mmetsp:Transcript_32326/g.69877  ORF Transcript_32326/g.69877 Transcript_32326/m.69877 type:complete len:225 (-) Transcript_32326:5-679(-)